MVRVYCAVYVECVGTMRLGPVGEKQMGHWLIFGAVRRAWQGHCMPLGLMHSMLAWTSLKMQSTRSGVSVFWMSVYRMRGTGSTCHMNKGSCRRNMVFLDVYA